MTANNEQKGMDSWVDGQMNGQGIFLCLLAANVWKPENVMNKQKGRQTDGQMNGQGIFLYTP